MEDENPELDTKMKELQIHALRRKWDSFKYENADDLIEPLNLAENTAIHMAVRSNNHDLLQKLLDKLKEVSSDEEDGPLRRYDRCRRALRMGNAKGNTLLHQVMMCEEVKMVDIVLNFEKDQNLKQDDDVNLLQLRNNLGETPVYRAARYGKLRMLKCMAKYIRHDDLERHHFYRNSNFYPSILHIAIIGQHFDVAIWLSKQDAIKKIAFVESYRKTKALAYSHQESIDCDKKEHELISCLQLLSSMPSVFWSYNSHKGFAHNLIYACLPNKGYDDEDEDDDDYYYFGEKRDLESGNLTKTKAPVSSRINYSIWKLVAKGCQSVKEIWRTKKQNMQANELANLLVSIDKSWKYMNLRGGATTETEGVMPVIQPSNIAATRNALLLDKANSFSSSTPVEFKDYTPLLLAASTGIVEIVERIIEKYPDAVAHVSQHDGQNVLHVAVKHRQLNIYKHLKNYKLLNGLGCHIANHDRTLLHQVARMDYYDGGNKPGVVFQLQEELRWFQRVKKIVPGPYQLYRNEGKLTARELFDLEHSEMLKEAQEWIKSTAQSCSAVSVLVATVVFAAAYTVPGGTDDHGVPNLLNSSLFLFFTMMDVIGLATSLVSVMMFLSILTSPFQMQDFYKSLPRKLTMGFALLFISLTTTMLAFGSTILLTIRMENKKWSSFFISITFFPVTLFGLTQYPIVIAIKYRLKRLWKNIKKIIPNNMKTMSTKPTCKKDYSKYL